MSDDFVFSLEDANDDVHFSRSFNQSTRIEEGCHKAVVAGGVMANGQRDLGANGSDSLDIDDAGSRPG